MTEQQEYNGHPSYDHWNVALWVGNDEGLYNIATDLTREDFIGWCNERWENTPDGVEVTEDLAGYAWDSVNEDDEGEEE